MNILNCLTIPDTGVKLVDGSVVTLARFPGMKWIVHNGWYTYMNQQFMGWYFCSIPDQQVLPISDDDLKLLTVVSTNGGHVCPPPPPAIAPSPCHPHPSHVPHEMKYEIDRAFITVDTIAQRNELNKRLLPHGKIVRVNNVGGSPEYYEWDQVNQIWLVLSIGAVSGDYLTQKAADGLYASKSAVEELQKQVDEIEEGTASTWGGIA